jgi:hypothetical protein
MSLVRLSLLASALALAGCGGGSSSGSSGALSLSITDAPLDEAKHVYVQFSGLELHGPGGTFEISFTEPRQVDLLALNGGLSEPLLDTYTLDAGHYQWVRLKVDTEGELDTYLVTTDDRVHELTIPSSAQTGLKLVRGFDVPAGGTADFTIDFDLRKSIVSNAPNGYHLKPVLRIEDNVEVGSIAGEVKLDVYSCDDTGNAVYVFAGHAATAADINTGLTTGPLTTANVSYHAETDTYNYRAAFLSAGDYTVALTCDADADTAEATENLNFRQSYDVTVVAGQVTAQPFPAP